MNKTIGILGGTFDPVHNGHLAIAQCALTSLHLDVVLLQPNKIPYYKDKPSTLDNDRLAMLTLAISDYPNLVVSAFELHSSAYTCTYDVMTSLQQANPDTTYVFIMGMDSFLKLPTWRHGMSLLNVTNVCVLQRPHYPLDKDKLSPEQLELVNKITTATTPTKKAGEVFMLENPPTDISASQLRQMLMQHDYTQASQFVPNAVLEYIKEHNLYHA